MSRDPAFEWTKAPAEYLDYKMDWTTWLRGSDTIASHTVTGSAGITVDQVSHTSGIVTWWVAGGANGTRYDVTVKVTTAAGRIGQRVVYYKVETR